VSPGISPASFEQLRYQAQHCLIDFLKVEIQLGFTFSETAAFARDHGNLEHLQSAKREAGKAAASIRHFVGRIADPGIREQIVDRCRKLESVTEALW
jgi:hypothetical protein